MAATVDISESNGAGPTVTGSVANVNMGSTDAIELVVNTYPITATTNSFEKWNRIKLTDISTSTRIEKFKVYASGGLGTGCTHKTNARESSYGGAQTYNQASATDRSATYGYTQTMPTSAPSGQNVGIGGALSGSLTTNTTYSDYILMQIQTTGSATIGTSVTMTWAYDEVA
jgi:hypothetical protein